MEILAGDYELELNGSAQFPTGYDYIDEEVLVAVSDLYSVGTYTTKLHFYSYKKDSKTELAIDEYVTIKVVVAATDAPDEPDTPDTPDEPDTPDTPDEPDTPDTPDNPDTPDTPQNVRHVPLERVAPPISHVRDPVRVCKMQYLRPAHALERTLCYDEPKRLSKLQLPSKRKPFRIPRP